MSSRGSPSNDGVLLLLVGVAVLLVCLAFALALAPRLHVPHLKYLLIGTFVTGTLPLCLHTYDRNY